MTLPISIQTQLRFSPHARLFGTHKNASCCLLVAHPNDEIVGAGCLLTQLSDVRVIHVSGGTPQQKGVQSGREYSDRRKQECANALSVAGITAERITELDWPHFEISARLVELSRELLSIFRKTSPQIVLTHAYEGGHPDHDATAFGAHAAARLLRRRGLKPPVLFEMAIYPGDNGKSKIPEFLHSPSLESTTLVLDKRARGLKRQMINYCELERDILNRTPLDTEKFRQAPTYDFRLPPHFGTLHYEKLGWGITGKQWRSQAREALKTLFPLSGSYLQPFLGNGSASHARMRF